MNYLLHFLRQSFVLLKHHSHSRAIVRAREMCGQDRGALAHAPCLNGGISTGQTHPMLMGGVGGEHTHPMSHGQRQCKAHAPTLMGGDAVRGKRTHPLLGWRQERARTPIFVRAVHLLHVIFSVTKNYMSVTDFPLALHHHSSLAFICSLDHSHYPRPPDHSRFPQDLLRHHSRWSPYRRDPLESLRMRYDEVLWVIQVYKARDKTAAQALERV